MDPWEKQVVRAPKYLPLTLPALCDWSDPTALPFSLTPQAPQPPTTPFPAQTAFFSLLQSGAERPEEPSPLSELLVSF